jgi:hypothetical protein
VAKMLLLALVHFEMLQDDNVMERHGIYNVDMDEQCLVIKNGLVLFIGYMFFLPLN